MVVALVIFTVALFWALVAFTVPGLADHRDLAVVGVFVGLLLVARAFGRRRPAQPPKWIVIDGSNVMHWKGGTPSLEPVQEVLSHLVAQGYTPGVVFDANAGYLLGGKYRHDGAFGEMLGLPRDRVMVVPKGTPADPFLLTAARDLDARIVSNDRFRDWAEEYPEVRAPGRVIRGGFGDAGLSLELGEATGSERPNHRRR